MKKYILCALLLAGVAVICFNLYASVLIKYDNKDNINYTISPVCQGGLRPVKLLPETTDSIGFVGAAPCSITLENTVELYGGETIEINDGVITVMKGM